MTQPTHSDKVHFFLSMLSNGVSGQTGAGLDSALQAIINEALESQQSNIGVWEVVWGPTIEQFETDQFVVNTLYVARSDAGEYVVATAGTNPLSAFDWIVEDFFVNKQIPWIYALGSAPDAKISAGTAIGLAILQFMKPAAGFPGEGTTLFDFLTSVAAGDQAFDLTVTGHSLGGALSDAMAQWLLDTQSTWDPSNRATVAAMPSAGPTAGNAAYAAHQEATLSDRLRRYHNTLDVVPHAWQTSDLQEVPTLYAPDIPPSPAINELTDKALQCSEEGDYTQPQSAVEAIQGAMNTNIITSRSDFVNFITQMGYQHVSAYESYFAFDTGSLRTLSVDLAKLLAGRLGQRLAATASPPPEVSGRISARSKDVRVPIGGTVMSLPLDCSDPNWPSLLQKIRGALMPS